MARSVGSTIPEGSWTLEPHENWLGHDALYSEPADEPHPVMAFVAAHRGLGVSMAELFRSWGTDMADGPMLTGSTLEFPGEFRAGVSYRVTGTVESVERRSGRTLGEFDLLTARFELTEADAGGGPVAVVRNVYALPRRGTGS
jgi:hypothetical protein